MCHRHLTCSAAACGSFLKKGGLQYRPPKYYNPVYNPYDGEPQNGTPNFKNPSCDLRINLTGLAKGRLTDYVHVFRTNRCFGIHEVVLSQAVHASTVREASLVAAGGRQDGSTESHANPRLHFTYGGAGCAGKRVCIDKIFERAVQVPWRVIVRLPNQLEPLPLRTWYSHSR